VEDYNLLITSQRLSGAVEFWRTRLANVSETFRLGTGAPATVHESYESLTIHLSPAAREVLADIGAGDLGEFTVTTAAIALVLARYSRRTTVVFRTPVLAGSEASVDVSVPLIIDVDGRLNLADYLNKVARIVEESYVETLLPLRELANREGSVPFDNLTTVALADTRVHASSAASDAGDVRFQLHLDEGVIQLEWRSLEGFLAEGLAASLSGIIEQFARLDSEVRDLEIISAGDRHRLLNDFNNTALPSPHLPTAVDLFERQVQKSPDAPALIFQGQVTTYAELNARANRLAHHLRNQYNAGAETPVAIRMDRSDLMIVAILGILKAGAHFVPIDPQYPLERVNYILQETSLTLLITQADYVFDELNFSGNILALDLELSSLPEETANPLTLIDPASRAYVIHTSGSTGKPKGCELEHRNLSNYLHWSINYYFDDGPGGNFGLYSSLAFDFTLTNIFCSLVRGGSLYIYPQFDSIETILTHAFNTDSGIDVMKLTPSHIRLLEHLAVRECGVRKVIAGGEELTAREIEILRALKSDIEIYNEYGPTEATVGCIVKKIEFDAGPVTIGRPIANTSVFVLDDELKLMPIGVRGEICISGRGLARGYRNPEQTAAKFIPHPFLRGERLYRTGDIGRWLPDGQLQCFGRNDDQIKIRGYRVEMGEVESVLAEHPAISDAIVMFRGDKRGNKRLVAYLIANRQCDAKAVRQHAASKLPDYMIPADFVFLSEFPLNTNGKVDRRALPTPQNGDHPHPPPAAPGNDRERQLLNIWRELFATEHIGITDSFFQLGGDSLLAVQMVSRIWNSFAVETTIEDIFEAQTIVQLSERVGQASASSQTPGASRIEVGARSEELPLSFSQQRLWFLAQLEGPNSAYNLASAVRLDGDLDVAALERAISTVIERHEILRTTFAEAGGKPSQRISEALPFNLAVQDLASLPDEKQQIEVLRLATEESDRPFDLAAGPLLRINLFRLKPDAHILVLVMHHIIADGWSMSVLIREVSALYAAFQNNEESPLAALGVQYADFAEWQRRRVESDGYQSQLSYWKQQLAGSPSVIELPTDRPRPPTQSFHGSSQSFTLNAELKARLEALSHESGASLFMVLIAALAALLSRYANQQDIVIGSPVTNRPLTELEPLIGFFVNTVALRIDLSRNPSFRELLERVRRVALDGYANQEIPFEQLVDALELDRNLSHSPIFQVMLAHENLPAATLHLTGLTLTPLRVETNAAKFDLTLYVEESDTELAGSFEYNTDLFDGETIARMIGNFETMLAAIVKDPDLTLVDIPILSESERRLQDNWNSTARPYSLQCIHHLFEYQAERTPDAIALVFDEEKLTYRELNERANQLAHRLQRHGAGPEVLIGICMERSLEMVVGLMAILKAGAAYVPIDPAYPPERVRFMIADSRVPLLLTQAHLLGQLPETDAFVLCVDDEDERLAAEEIANPDSGSELDSLAYMIYTSGSTGRPKGALNTHRAISNRLRWMQDEYQLGRADRVLQKTPFSFDVSVWEFFWPLFTGAQMIIARPGGHRESDYLVDLIVQHEITTLHFVPSMLRAFLEESDVSRCTSLRRVICSGEALPVELQEKFFAHLSSELHNLYGPSEAAVDVTSWQCAADDTLHRVPIGRPIANTQIFIVDETLRPVPTGVPGELLIGGTGVGRGYHNDPSLTANKFIPDPFSAEPSARLYRTGDLARYRSDGAIEFLGRLDHQVKIRGFRIELGEVEATLRELDTVHDCVVTAPEDRGIRRLVAYLVFTSEAQSPAGLRESLLKTLPEYMVPAAFVALSALPLLPNGKVDRKALPVPPAPQGSKPTPEGGFTSRQQLFREIWRDVLRLDSIGIHDNFFELGGDSILSIQVVARASQAGLRVTPKQFFQNQTIAELAQVAVEKTNQPSTVNAVGPAPLTPIQHWFFEQDLEEAFHFNQSVLIQVPADVNAEIMAQAVSHIYEHHDGLRLRFSRAGDNWTQQVIAPDSDTIFSFVDLSGEAGEKRAAAMRAIARQVERSLDIEAGPLMSVCLFGFGTDAPARLWVVIHHLAIDGVSWRILLEDLHNVYEQLSGGAEAQLPSKTTSFREWAQLLVDHAGSAEGKTEAKFWLESLQSNAVSIPVDHPASAHSNRIAATEAILVSLDEAETLSLLQEVPRAYNTRIDDVLLTALALGFQQCEGGNSLLLDFEGHGRREFRDGIDLSRTVGWFTTISPVLVQVEADAPLDETLKSVKEQIRRIPEDAFGYALHKYLSPDADLRSQLRALPRPEVMFNYLGQTDLVLPQNSGWDLASEDVGSERAQSTIRSHLLEIVSMVSGGRLQVSWVYSRNIHDRETVDRFARAFIETLRLLIRHCCAANSCGFTPTDFPQAKLNQRDLDKLAQLISVRSPTAGKDSVSDIYELSPMQQGLLFHSLFDLESPAYFEQLSCEIEGEVNVELLRDVWKDAIERHATLRTGFFWHDLAHPVQVVFRSIESPWEMYDWRSQEPAQRKQGFSDFLARDRARGFDLGQAPLFRCTLIRESETSYRFCWSHHHILLDGWSAAILMKEVFNSYDSALREGKPPTLPQPRPYRSYIEWLQAQDDRQAAAHWRREMKGFYAPTPLPEDPTRGPLADDRTQKEVDLLLSEEFSEQIKANAKSLKITTNSLIRAVWALILSRYSGSAEVMFGVTVAGRPPLLEGIESMVGLFINTLPARFHIKPDDSLSSWLSDIHVRQSDLDQYAYSSLTDIQKWSDIPSGTPLFDTLLVFENYPVDRSFNREPGGLHIGDVRVFDQTSYPLTLTAVPGTRMLLRLTYDTSRFEQATIERMLGHLRTLLEGFVENPTQPLANLQMLTADEQHELFTIFNNTSVPFDATRTFMHRFEEGAAAAPARIVAAFEERSLTWEQLNQRANRQARNLLAVSPLGADDLVCVALRRTERMMESILAVWKCGAAYVPLDVDYPESRLLGVIAESGAKLVITETGLLPVELEAKVESLSPAVKLVKLDRMPAQADGSNLERSIGPGDLAYVIYTSGSTGQPKGAMVEHGGMLNHLLAKVSELEITRESVIAQNASHCFDISVWQFFAGPMVGGKTVIYGEEVVLEPERFLGGLAAEQVSIVEVVPTYLGILLERLAERPELAAKWKYLVVTGEVVSVGLVESWFARFAIPLVNAYGPTEAADDITHYRMEQAPASGSVPVGKPVQNLKIYIVDEEMNLCPVGVKGEICVSGIGVGRGYLHDEEKTRAVFLEDPFLAARGERGVRLYRTGDVGCFLPDGNILLYGRKDYQVKVRGHRIELGEIEVVLERQPEVDRAVVLLREDTHRGLTLVAHVLPSAGQRPTSEALRKFLLAQVPDYMVPATYSFLDSLPLTRQGKIDRKALHEPEPAPERERVHIAPRNTDESKLVAIWEEVLAQPGIGVTDDYFDLGGHSILAVSLMAKIEKEFGKRIPLAQLFRNPTIEELAVALRGDNVHSQWEELVEIRGTGSRPPLFIMPGAGGNVIYLQPLANRLSDDLPVYGLQAIGLDGVTPPLTRIQDIALRNVQAIRTVSPQGPYHLAGHSFGGMVAFEMSQILRREDFEVDLVAILDTPAPVFKQDTSFLSWDDAQWLVAIASEIGTFLGTPIDVSYEELANLDPEAQLTRLLEKIGSKSSWAAGVDSVRLRAYLNVYKANFKMSYEPPAEILPVPVVLFKSSETHSKEVAATPELETLKQDPAWGWTRFSSEPVTVVDVPGTHLSMLLEPNVAVLAEKLEELGWMELVKS
jgi:amino acid adenylation domain-containing protein/non-ribosomal peptide synthase protein (TIGR01720 family)